ncbi:hypothetical protein EVAR_9113_1 [Eumeta japonica]|uniref:Nucleic-acid-binding protein from transposon X-element n=1 Tax=Eumeta variegata TaxID=151549 RepID=A0A4C1TWA9_EUMVA|nr:hypothetical protein EVAR_9113_1 [Eumeta japonica]
MRKICKEHGHTPRLKCMQLMCAGGCTIYNLQRKIFEGETQISRCSPRSTKRTPNRELKENLVIQDLPVQSLRRITNHTREPLDIALVTANTTSVHNATKRQCFNCQFYEHSSKNCYQRARCVKCLGDHGTAACTRNKDTDGSPACVFLQIIRLYDQIFSNGGPRKDPLKNITNDTSTEDIKVMLSVITSIDIEELALLAKKFKGVANPVEKIIVLAEHASLVEANKNNKI